MSETPILRLVNLTKYFGPLKAVDDFTLDFHDGELFTIVGPSGCGKTTLIRMLAGMENPSSGDIFLHGERINDVPANLRPTCMVFQSLALFPHRTVGENIEFPLKIKAIQPSKRRERCLQLMRQLRMPENYYPRNVNQCSGGERQRVALARALAFDPEILFFDEPLSAIDFRLRKALEKELKDIHRETGKTFIYITHSLEEAMVMSDRIGIMQYGRLVQVGSPDQIYNKPRNKFVSEFMGEVNVLEVSATADGRLLWTESDHSFATPRKPDGFKHGHLVIRPENMRFVDHPEDADNCVRGILYNEYSLGSRMQYQIRVGENVFLVEKLREHRYRGNLDDEVLIGWNDEDGMLVSD